METLHFPPPFRAQVSELQQSINIFLAAMFCHTLSPRLTVVVGQTSSTDLGSRGEIGGLTELFHFGGRGAKGLGGSRATTSFRYLFLTRWRRSQWCAPLQNGERLRIIG